MPQPHATHTMPDKMQAAAIDQFCGVETIGMQTLPAPGLEPDEVLIRVEAAGVAAWDPLEREGGFAEMFGIEPTFPYVLGSDGAGTVAAVGEQVSRARGSVRRSSRGRRRGWGGRDCRAAVSE